MVASYLIRAGFDTRQAHTGPQAVDEARRFSPDVVVLDLELPELDGLEVCRRIRSFSDCYILMLTARGSEDDKISGLTLGADDYITKPFSIRELVTRVHAVLRRPRTSTIPPQVTTPLSVLTVYLDGLQDGVVDWSNATHTIMADQLTRLTRSMEDIDDVSRAQEHRIDLDLAEEGLGDLLHTAAAAAGEAYADKGVDFRSRPLRTPPGYSWTGNASAR